MIVTEFHNVEDVYAAARQISSMLAEHRENEAATELEETMKTFWTTASEAVGEIKLSLLRVRPIVQKSLNNDTLQLLDSAVSGATKLFNGTNSG